jgi:hypothetical protein
LVTTAIVRSGFAPNAKASSRENSAWPITDMPNRLAFV